MPSDRARTARALKNAAAAGDEEAVRRLTAKLQEWPAGQERAIGEMTPEEIARLDPREHGGVASVPLLDDPLLGVLAGGALFGKPAIAAAKAVGKAAQTVGGALGAGGAGAYAYDKLFNSKE